MNYNIADHFASDESFDQLYPVAIRHLSEVHWTPLAIAKAAAEYLVDGAEDARIMDIGAGAGKFCIAGSYFTAGHFTGIEQKQNLVRAGNKVLAQLDLERVTIVQANFIDVSLQGYTGIYCYNSFFEHIARTGEPEDEVANTPELYELYQKRLVTQLVAMPPGTRLATYWLDAGELPGSYRLVKSAFDGLLKLWVKAG
jgi:tRNA A58 N-methylase Trm61